MESHTYNIFVREEIWYLPAALNRQYFCPNRSNVKKCIVSLENKGNDGIVIVFKVLIP